MALPTDPKARKAIPVYSGFIAYFPDAIAAVAQLSQKANDQHNPGEPLHWAKEKSTDEPDAGARHMLEPLMIGGTPYDSDGAAHLIKKAWRAMAELQRWLDAGNIPFAPLTPQGEAQMLVRCGHTLKYNYLTCTRPSGHLGECEHHEPKGVKLPNICRDCGVDLNEGMHSGACLVMTYRR